MDKCIICGNDCKNNKFYDGWHSLCSDNCYMKYLYGDE